MLDLLRAAYEPMLAFADEVDDEHGWLPTRLPGWTVRDLIFHLANDCQRALVALATPDAGPADTDEVSYWREWQPGTPGARDGLRGTRIMASAWSSVRGPAGLYAETARAVLVQAGRADLKQIVQTQQHRLTVASLLHTLAVEATVHQLDLDPVLPAPAPELLAAVRHVLDGLLAVRLDLDWSDAHYVRVGTGREPLTDAERAALGSSAERFPLFG